MRLKATIPMGVIALGIASSVCAAPSIEFIDRDDSIPTYLAVRCVATHANGLAYRAASQHIDNITAVPLADLLAGASGQYKAECTASLNGSHERYTAKFDAVKFQRGETGNEAPEYDENGFGYGVKVPLSQTRSRCYDPITRRMDQGCLDDYYGNGRYFLDPYFPAPDVTFNENREYSSNIGVFLKDNPHHPQAKARSLKAAKAASIASPFQ